MNELTNDTLARRLDRVERHRRIRELVARLVKEAGLRLEHLDKCRQGDQL